MPVERLEAIVPFAGGGLAAAALLIALAALGGWAAGRLVGARIDDWVAARASNLAGGFVGRLCGLTRFTGAAVLRAVSAVPAPPLPA